MQYQRLTFAGMDLDTDEHLLPAGSTRENLNVRFYNPQTGATGTAETLAGHRALAAGMATVGTNEVIGGCEAPHLESVFYFVWNSTGAHRICQLNWRTFAVTAVLEWTGLNLNRANRISSCFVVEQTLYWTDNLNEPRKLNLQHLAAEPALYARLKLNEPHFLDHLRRGPQHPLEAALSFDATRGEQQLLPRRGVQFTYRYVYVHGEPSVFAPWSAMLPFKPVRPYFNVATLAVPLTETVSELVKTVEIGVREGDTGPVRIVAELPRAAVLAAAPYRYYGDVAGSAVAAVDAIKLYDYVPRRARASGYVDNRIFFGGYPQGFARPQATVAVSAVTDFLPTTPQGNVYEALVSFDSERGGDPPLRVDLVFGYFLLVAGTHGQASARYRVVNVRNVGLLGGESSFLEGLYQGPPAPVVTLPGGFNPFQGEGYRLGKAVTGILDYRQPLYSFQELFDLGYTSHKRLLSVGYRALGNFSFTLTLQNGFTLRQSLGEAANRRVFKANSVRRVGVQFYDWAGRTPGVSLGAVPFQVAGRMEHTLPLADGLIGQWPSGVPATQADPLTTGLRWQLDNARATQEIPAWATSYAIVTTRDLVHGGPPVQGVSCDGGYGIKDKDGQIVFKSQQYRSDHEYAMLNIANLFRQGLGYQFAAGDRVRLWVREESLLPEDNASTSGAGARVVSVPSPRAALVAHDVEILAVTGNYLVLPLVNLGSRAKELYEQGTGALDEEQDVPALRVAYEVYAPYRPSEDEPYYEASPRYDVVRTGGVPGYGTTTGVLDGDAYLVLRRDYLLEGRVRAYQDKNADGSARTPATGLKGVTTSTFTADSSGGREDAERLLAPDLFVLELSIYGDQLGTSAVILVESGSPDDPDLWDRGLGRITAELRDMKEEDCFANVRFSNVYNQGAATNGLSSFEALNEEQFPREHQAIRRLEPVGTNLLVIHELGASTAYIGTAQLQDTNGKTLVSLSDRVIGSHRPLAGGAYGCQHPETVRQLAGYVYWWDCRRGVVVRYANDGLTEISGYGLVGYFHNRRQSQLAVAPRPMAWFDALHKEYVLSLGVTLGTVTEPAVAFSEASNRWTSFYAATPEYSLPAGSSVISFVGDTAYLHDALPFDSALLLGAHRPAYVSLAVNDRANQVKILEVLTEEGTLPWVAEYVTTPEGQRSHLDAEDFDTQEGLHHAGFLRDELTPNVDAPLIEGDVLRSTQFALRLRHQLGDNPNDQSFPVLQLRAVTVGYVLS